MNGDPTRPRSTMRDVAALAGVSVKTVSRVVNAEGSVHPDLVVSVRRAVQQLDFRPNLAASNLRRIGGRSGIIGVLVADIADPFSAAALRSVEDAARARGMGVYAASVDEDACREREQIRLMIDRQVDGLIIMPAGDDHGYLLPELRTGPPMVFVGRPARLLPADAVVAENVQGAQAGVEHLLARGHARIGFLGGRLTEDRSRERYEGFLRAMRRLRLPLASVVAVHGLGAAADAAAAARTMLSGSGAPTALFAANATITAGVVQTLQGQRLSERVALVGFDEVPYAELLSPGLTTVAHDPAALGVAAVQLLFRRLDGDREPPRIITLTSTLRERGSGEISAHQRPVLVPRSVQLVGRR